MINRWREYFKRYHFSKKKSGENLIFVTHDKNFSTRLLKKANKGDKIIYTTDWGNFKIRKNGKYWLHIGDEIIRVQQYKEVAHSG